MLAAGSRAVSLLLVLAVLAVLAGISPTAFAEGAECSGELVGCVNVAKKTVIRRVDVDAGDNRNIRPKWTAPQSSNFDEFRSAANRQPADAVGCLAADDRGDACITIFSTDTRPAPSGNVTVVTITPYQAALTAAAYLPLKPGKPTIGPPPTLNKWKMAAVGYPLWIWAEGDLDPAPVSQTVSGLSVSLDASLAKIVYDMGDGTKITCGPGTPWHRGKVGAGAPSPDCGHTYTKPSLPKGDYTITATTHWSVAWTAGGQSGTIPFTQTSTTSLAVGEVQTLVR